MIPTNPRATGVIGRASQAGQAPGNCEVEEGEEEDQPNAEAKLSQNYKSSPPKILKKRIQDTQRKYGASTSTSTGQKNANNVSAIHDEDDDIDGTDDDDKGNGWTVMCSKKKKNLRVTFEDSHKSTKPPVISEATKEPTENDKFAIHLQALEEKRRRMEKGSAGSAPATVVKHTTRHDISPIDALTFDKANTVASIGGDTAAPEKMNNWRYVELLVDSGAVDNVGDPRAFAEYKLRESDG